MSAQTNAALAHQIYHLFNANEFDAVLALTTEDVEILYIPFGQTFHGREGFRAFMQGFKRTFSNLQITEITHQIATDTEVVTEFKASGRHTGPLITPCGQAPPTGRIVELRVCEVWEVQDGKLAFLRNYQDTANIWRQLDLTT